MRQRRTEWPFSFVRWDFGLRPAHMAEVERAVASESGPEPVVNLWRLSARVTELEQHSHITLGVDEGLTREIWDEIYRRIDNAVRRPRFSGCSMGPIRGIYEYSFDVCKRRRLTRVESALVDCALLVQELGVFLDFWPEVYDEPDVFVEPNSRMSLGMKLWDETRERCGKLGRRRSKA